MCSLTSILKGESDILGHGVGVAGGRARAGGGVVSDLRDKREGAKARMLSTY